MIRPRPWRWMLALSGAVTCLVAVYSPWWVTVLVGGRLLSTFIVAEAQVMPNG